MKAGVAVVARHEGALIVLNAGRKGRINEDVHPNPNEEIVLSSSGSELCAARLRPFQDRRRFHSAIDSSSATPRITPVASPAQLVTGTGLRTTM